MGYSVLSLLVPWVKHPVPEVPLTDADAPKSPRFTANFFSKLVWNWMNPIMYTGYVRQLERQDLWQLDERESTHHLVDVLDRHLQRRTAQGYRRAALYLALNDTFGWVFWTATLLKVFADSFMSLSTILVRHLLTFTEDSYRAHKLGSEAPPLGRGMGYAVGLYLMQVASAFCMHHFFDRTMLTGARARAALIALVYRKSLRLSNKARLTYTNGMITNLMSTDTYRVDYACQYGPMWTSLVQVILCLILLLVNIGYSSLAGFGLLVVVSPVLTIVMGMFSRLRKRSTRFTDARVRLIQEILGSMRVIKFYVWEAYFMKRLGELRLSEASIIRYMLVLRSGVFAVALSLPVFASVLSFITYSLTGHQLQAGVIFASLSLFNILRMPLMMLPLVMSSLSDAYVATNRLTEFVFAEESETGLPINKEQEYAIDIENATLSWMMVDGGKLEKPTEPSLESKVNASSSNGNEKKAQSDMQETTDVNEISRAISQTSTSLIAPLNTASDVEHLQNVESQAGLPTSSSDDGAETSFKLHDITIRVRRGELVCLVGTVGSGKTSIMSAILGQMHLDAGSISLSGGIGYCAQQAWIQNTSVRENITFGLPFDQDRYNAVVEGCALLPDFEILPDGDLTEIGERGITVSGGQKQRINLARAAYYDSGIVLMDDPLSAVDAHVGRHLFENCINGLMKDKTRLLITHQLHVLDKVDRIYVIDDGRIKEEGSYDTLVARNGAFAQILKKFDVKQEVNEEIQDDEEEVDVLLDEVEHDDAKSGGASDETETEIKDEIKRQQSKKSVRAPKKLMQEEERASGSVSTNVYFSYIRAGGGFFAAAFIILLVILSVGANVCTSLWLSYWSEQRWNRSEGWYVGIYVALGASTAICVFIVGFSLTIMGNAASRRLNDDAMRRILRAPMSFFDTTPIGRIMNRFSKDIDTTDNLLSDAYRMFLMTFGTIIGTLILIVAFYYWFAVPLVPLVALFYTASHFYRSSARQMKRLDSVLRSHVFAHFGETLTGLITVRAYGVQDSFVRLNEVTLDNMNRAYFLTISNQRWLGIRLDMTADLLIFIVAILSVTSRFSTNASSTGLVLSYCLGVVGMVSWMVRQFSEVENDMNAVERLSHYGNGVEVEAADRVPEAKLPADWPQTGSIEMKNVHMSYREGLPEVLKGLNLSVKGGERIGVVGRTGAGKSSLMVALYRMAELSSGQILIDGVDISRIGLHDLREKLSIIPQDPTLFQGTLRNNLDPSGTKTDAELWQCLRRAWFVDPGSDASQHTYTLESNVDDEGSNFSLGQRQLLALARALLRNSRILVLDEATSSVDFDTDAKIQYTIQNEFKGITLLCIAHRLRTIIGYDRILVMSEGSAAEYASPLDLFRQRDSIFRSMCDKSRITEEDIVSATEK